MTDKDLVIKVPKGTIVKIFDHPVMLKKSLYIRQLDETTFKLEDHEIMVIEDEEN